jgi:hypothetical protein
MAKPASSNAKSASIDFHGARNEKPRTRGVASAAASVARERSSSSMLPACCKTHVPETALCF